MEDRSLVSESLGMLTAGIGVASVAMIARPEAGAAASGRSPAASFDVTTGWPGVDRPTVAAPVAPVEGGAVGGTVTATTPALWVPETNRITIAAPGATAGAAETGGGSVGSSHGGSGAVAAMPTRDVTPGVASSQAAYQALPASGGPVAATRTVNTPRAAGIGFAPEGVGFASDPGGGFAGGMTSSALAYTSFPVTTLDYNDGSILVPGGDRLATLGGNVDLRAQVRDAAVASYSWDTSGLTDATAITGASSYRLQFQWDTSVAVAKTEAVTLTVTDVNSQVETRTYTFQVPAGSGATAGTGTAAWPRVGRA